MLYSLTFIIYVSNKIHVLETCSENGNIYAQVPGTDCTQFTQATATLPPQTHTCPDGLQFDLKTCVCNYPSDTVCYDTSEEVEY